jgi:hypothetical protein
LNKEQLTKEIRNALNKWESWSSFTVTKKGHGFEIEYVYTGPNKAMSLEDVVIWKHNLQYRDKNEEHVDISGLPEETGYESLVVCPKCQGPVGGKVNHSTGWATCTCVNCGYHYKRRMGIPRPEGWYDYNLSY